MRLLRPCGRRLRMAEPSTLARFAARTDFLARSICRTAPCSGLVVK
jgi:hypothetical protein